MKIYQLPDLQVAVEAAGLGEQWPLLAPHCRPSIRVLVPAAGAAATPAATLATGASRLGGLPDLPANVAWPTWQGRPLSFLGQLNLAELVSFDRAGLLPPVGLLAFFYDAQEQPWGFDSASKGQAAVLFFEEGAGLLPRPLPPGLAVADYTAFTEAALAFAAEWTLPNPWDEDLPLPEAAFTASQQAAYASLLQLHSESTSRVLGNPDAIQGPMRQECSAVTAGLAGGATLASEPASDWELLLQLDSYEAETGMLWEDLGRLYFWLPRAALAARDFSRAWVVLQCY